MARTAWWASRRGRRPSAGRPIVEQGKPIAELF
jgi:hypothetical protein